MKIYIYIYLDAFGTCGKGGEEFVFLGELLCGLNMFAPNRSNHRGWVGLLTSLYNFGMII